MKNLNKHIEQTAHRMQKMVSSKSIENELTDFLGKYINNTESEALSVGDKVAYVGNQNSKLSVGFRYEIFDKLSNETAYVGISGKPGSGALVSIYDILPDRREFSNPVSFT